jgi:hypothetical protein
MYFLNILELKIKLREIDYSHRVLPDNKLGILAISFYMASELK